MPNQIPTIFKPTGVSFCQPVINTLEKGQMVKMELDSNNKYDEYAIKIMTEDDKMCGFVPRKMKIKVDGVDIEIELNKLVHQKFERMQKKYNLKVYELYKWDGPTGYEVIFEKK
jgi:hypothetical protein